jgi:ATP-dependent DNA helicase Rep
VDFDDLILLPVKLFEEHADILEKWQNKVRYLLVDEYQDTNASQYLLVKMLIGMRNQFTVVGDDDQSIYAWRGARPENLMLLKDDYPSLKVVMLEQNYRSTSRILRCANVLIANNPHEFEKQLWSEMGHGDEIRVIRCRNEDAEAERVAMEILSLHLRTDRPYSDFAILYRGNYQAKLIELKLQHHQVPYRLSGGNSFFGRQEVKDLMAYFRLIVNPDDDNAFLRVINVPRREIGSTTLEKLGNYATERKISMYAATDEIGLGEHLDAASPIACALQALHGQGARAMRRRRPDRRPAQHGHGHRLRELAAHQQLQRQGCGVPHQQRLVPDRSAEEHPGERRRRRHDHRGRHRQAGAARHARAPAGRGRRRRRRADDDPACLQGPGIPYVFIMGMEEEILPHRSSIEADTIEEERRLAYVGITRARQTLAFTFAAKRKQYGEIIDCAPSRFLDELPPDDLAWEGNDDTPTEVKAVRGNNALADIRAMLKR